MADAAGGRAPAAGHGRDDRFSPVGQTLGVVQQVAAYEHAVRRRGARPSAPGASMVHIVPVLLGGAVVVVGSGWIIAAANSLRWFGASPVDVYRTVDQPPILVLVVGIWYLVRNLVLFGRRR
jgi:hypothetical protein